MPAKDFSAVRRRLLSWYKHNRRDLPWRKTTHPYAIWISETMLQQTQVKIVLPYYERFLNRFPTVEALARAPLDRVLHAWAGLGYYRRAANLKTAARQIVRIYGRELPGDYTQLRALAGIGDYTAGAILSIAFGKNHPAIDGNVTRVLGRFCATHSETKIRAAAAKLVAGNRPGDVNQALMELGATLCTPKTTNCAACPLTRECRSRSRDSMISTRRVRRISFTNVVWPLAIVRCRGKILLRRRTTGKLLVRLWELPAARAKTSATDCASCVESCSIFLSNHALFSASVKFAIASPTAASGRRSICSTLQDMGYPRETPGAGSYRRMQSTTQCPR